MVELRQIAGNGKSQGRDETRARKERGRSARGDSTIVPKVYLHLHSVIKLSPFPRY